MRVVSSITGEETEIRRLGFCRSAGILAQPERETERETKGEKVRGGLGKEINVSRGFKEKALSLVPHDMSWGVHL